jgi:hypothetical protein
VEFVNARCTLHDRMQNCEKRSWKGDTNFFCDWEVFTAVTTDDDVFCNAMLCNFLWLTFTTLSAARRPQGDCGSRIEKDVERSGRGVIYVQSHHYFGETEKRHENSQSPQSLSWPMFEKGHPKTKQLRATCSMLRCVTWHTVAI